MKIKEKYFQNSSTFLIKILGHSNVKAFFCKKWFFVLKRLKLPRNQNKGTNFFGLFFQRLF